eukprot:137466-Karenia_brevis.AAC.1
MGASWVNLFACDIDATCREMLKGKPHPPAKVHDDIEHRDLANMPETDLYVFTPPCQSFSIAGKMLGLSDRRGQ